MSLKIYYPFYYKLCKVLTLSYKVSEIDKLVHKVTGNRHLFPMCLRKIIYVFLILKAPRLASCCCNLVLMLTQGYILE